ncbi:MAG: acyl-CoA dehydrogenase family protein [Chloroflexota bacterium]|nr:acyl-CoA dehydrogenase family protein [Chloroflexota bacterium]
MSSTLADERAEWRDRIAAIGDTLRGESETNEELRQLSPATEAALRSVDAFQLCSPDELGGVNAHPRLQTQVIADITSHDSSAGWCALIGAHESAWLASRLPDGAVERIFANAAERWPVTCGSIAPEGEAEQVEGGWMVTGRWGWASGIHHSDYVLAQCRIPAQEPEPGKPPPLVTVAAPKDDVVVEDTWHTLGMRGTGSTHYRYDSVFVPDEMCLAGFERPPLRGDGWLARPTVTFLTAAGYGFPLGVAKRAVEEITRQATAHTRTGQRASIAEQQHFQGDLGRCVALVEAMEGYGHHLFEELLEAPIASLEDAVRMDDRARAALRWAHQAAEDVVRTAHEHAGGPAVYSDNVLARLLRDIQTASQHVIQTQSAYIRRGQHQLGIPVRPGL